MSRLSFIVSIVLLGLLSMSWAGNGRSKAIETRRVALEDELRALLKDHGAAHPEVSALKQRIALLTADAAQGNEIVPKGLLVVLSKDNVAATLKDARVRSLGGRAFLVGLDVEGPKITRPTFVGKTVWIPLDGVTQMIELEDPKGNDP
jgi:hypothetical protein